MDRWPDCALDLFRGEETIGAWQRPEHRSTESRGPTSLVEQGMGELLKQDLISRPSVHGKRNLIAHRAGGKKKRRFLTQEIGDHVLQQIDCRVFALLLVSDFRFAHDPPHRCRRAGDRVAEQVDHYHSIISILLSPTRRETIVAAAHTAITARPESTNWGVIPTGC